MAITTPFIVRRLTPLIAFMLASLSVLSQVPSFNWANKIGASAGSDVGVAIKTDLAGNVYTAGTFSGTVDFDPGAASFNLTSAGGLDIFIVKFDPSGNFVWAKQVGGTSNDFVASLVLDATGSIYTAGYFFNTVDFDPGTGNSDLTAAGSSDGFISKLDPSGNFVWAKQVGGVNSDRIEAMDLHGSSIAFLGTFFITGDFDPGPGTATLTSAGAEEVFVVSLDLNGILNWAGKLGGIGSDQGRAISIDATGNVYAAGIFNGTSDFDPGTGASNLTASGTFDTFVTKLTSAGNFAWAKRIGGTGITTPLITYSDVPGFVHVSGTFDLTTDVDPGVPSVDLTSNGNTDVFLVLLDANGNYVWSKTWGGTGFDISYGFATDVAGNLFINGSFQNTVDFDPGTGVANLSSLSGSTDIYISKLDGSGNYLWAGRIGGSNIDGARALTIDVSGNIFTTGFFRSTADMDPGSGTFNLTSGGGTEDVFIQKLNPTSEPVITSFSPTSGPAGTSVTISGLRFSSVAANNAVYFGGAKAIVTAATSTQLTVTAPAGATYEPISVTTGGLTGFSNSSFLLTFPDGGNFLSCSFASPVQYGLSDFGHGLAVGDLDKDGKMDVVTTNYQAGVVQVFRNKSSVGTIDASSFEVPVNFTVGSQPLSVTVSDIDGDGKLDIVASSFNSSMISVFRNNSSPGFINAGSFDARVDLSCNSQPLNVVANDLDGDGKVDLAVSDNNSNTLSLWRNIGSPGSISAASFDTRFTISTQSAGFNIADIDLDGKPDLIGGESIGTHIGILRNISTPGSLSAASFQARQDFTVGAWVDHVDVADLDRDGKPDIVASSWPAANFTVLRNSSTPGTINSGSFDAGAAFALGGLTEPRGVEISDLDGDGLPEITVLTQVAGKMLVYKNVSSPGSITTASFNNPVAYVAGGNLRRVIAADFDGDGRSDLATTSWSGPSLNIIRNEVLGITTVSGFLPISGSVGTAVTITGTNFSTRLADNLVSFNGKPGYVTAATTTQLTVIVPGGATTGPLSVTVACGAPITTSPFTVTPLVYNTCSTVTLSGGGNYIQVNRNATLEPASLTIEALVNFGNIPLFGVIAAKPDGTTAGDSYAIWYESGLLRAGVRLGGGVGLPWTPVLNQWYHIALTYNSTTQIQRLYVNGEILASGSSLPPVYSADHLLFGGDINFGVHDGFFPGQLDEIRFWNVERTPLEIVANLNNSLTGTESGLVLYHKINEVGQGAGITVINSATSTGPTNNGVTVGNATTPVFQGTCSCVPSTQRDALIALYNSTGGAGWTDNTGWLNVDVSTWYGITVTGCDVTDITLDGNNLIGTLPPEIGDLPMLEGLSLGANQLSGGIPPEIGNLTNLIGLNLSINQLDGSVPPEIGNLVNLEALALANNSLSGFLPIELESLSSLQFAFLGFNQFTGNAPAVGLNSVDMNTLQLQSNQLTDLPDLNAYSAISSVNVANNQLTFDDLEPYMGLGDFTYSPQAMLPPGGFVSFLPGGTLTIPFTTGGSANSYQWYRNNVLIPGATSATYSKPGAVAGDVGSYEVRVTNSIVPFLTLTSLPFTVITDPCASTTPTSGGLDATFAPLISAPSYFYGVATQSTGKIITSTSYTIENSVIQSGMLRFNANGSLDNTFNSNPHDGLFLVLPDDRIIATYADGTYTYPIRLDANGNEDAAFKANVPQYYSGNISALARQPNGKILVGATAFNTPPFVERINTDGTSDGLLTDANGLDLYVIRVQSDGYILLGGQFPGGIIRLDPTGAVDPSFNPIAGASDFVTDIAIQTDGKILVAGYFHYFNDLPHEGIVRLNPNGSIDNTFTGVGITDLADAGSYVSRILIQSDNKILLGGNFNSVNGAARKNLVRLNPDGTVDCVFDPGVSSDADIDGLAIQTDGKVLITGSFTSYEGTQRYGLARVNAGAALTITLQPSDVLICDGGVATFSVAATGTTNITYQWQFSPGGAVPYVDVIDGGAYSGATTSTLSINTTGMFGAGRYRCRINGDGATQVITNNEGLFLYTIPTPPPAVGGSACGASAVTLTSSGVANGNYRWYTVATGGTAIAGAFNNTYITPVLASTTTYYVAANNGVCESPTRTPVIATINTIPSAPTTTGGTACGPNPVLLTASGSINGNYRWYTTSSGGTAIAGEVNSTYATPVLFASTTFYASINDGTCESATRTAVTATINTLPAAPTTAGATDCASTPMTLTASGGTNGQYRWYTVATGGIPIAAEVNSTYLTPPLTVTTTYFVAINDGTCESTRTPVTATVSVPSKPTVVTTNCTAIGATLTGPAGFASYAWSNGATTQQIAVTLAGSYTLTVTTSAGCVSPVSDPVVFTSSFCNQPPTLQPATVTTTVQAVVSVNLSSLASDLDNNIDLSTLQIIAQPASGAIASINGNLELVVDYSSVVFAGTDQVTVQVCDVAGACVQQVITIEVAGDITVFNALSPNGDGKNDVFYIQYIDALPDTRNNKVTIFNRWGSPVFEVSNYDNVNNVFRGIGNNGSDLPPGTYYYTLEFSSGMPKRTGFISLKR